LKKLQIL